MLLYFVGGLGGNSGNFILIFEVVIGCPSTRSIVDLLDVILFRASSTNVGEFALSSLPLKSVVLWVVKIES